MGHIALQHWTPARSHGQCETSSGKRQHGRSNVRAGMSDPPLDVKLKALRLTAYEQPACGHANTVPDARTDVCSSESNCAANPRACLGLEVGSICHASALRKITHSSESSRTEKLPIAHRHHGHADGRHVSDSVAAFVDAWGFTPLASRVIAIVTPAYVAAAKPPNTGSFGRRPPRPNSFLQSQEISDPRQALPRARPASGTAAAGGARSVVRSSARCEQRPRRDRP